MSDKLSNLEKLKELIYSLAFKKKIENLISINRKKIENISSEKGKIIVYEKLLESIENLQDYKA